MNIKKTVLSTSMALALGTVGMNASAALTTGTVLNFSGVFTMDTGPVAGVVATPIKSGNDGGIIIGVAQDTNGHASHGTFNPAHALTKGGIDFEWNFFNNAGMHFTTAGPTVVTDSGTTKTLDFSGWRVTWNGIPAINMGGGTQNCGTSNDGICMNGTKDISGTFNNGTGLATIVCSTSSCSASSTFTLTYNAIVPQGDPSGFGGVAYGVNISGDIPPHAAVPVPAAAWLLGSGLVGLVGVARRRKTQG